ncbi:MAG: LysR family transcriptional regulator [Pelagimonas sp.]|nr:LysR family transcriptional regulator [Pelagimonas sp.]
MDSWDEIRTAYHVARLGTVSGAADMLGVHHATVIRHVDALETRLGVKLFQRHARGYTATEAGQDLLRVAQATDDQMQQLEGRIRGRGSEVSGELVVTSLAGLAPMVIEPLVSFRRQHPELIVRFLTDERLFRLEYGEAHVALRAGPTPQEPDNVVQPFAPAQVAMYASQDYVNRCGRPDALDNLTGHEFVGHDRDDIRAPFEKWLRAHVPEHQITFRCTDLRTGQEAILAGAGIGFVGVKDAERIEGLVQIFPPQDEWSSQLWLVTHVDLHRTAKVQAFLKHLKEHAGSNG